jgi:hypothetical protein
MFKAVTVAGLTSAQSLVQDTQKDVNKEGTVDHKERNSTISMKAQRSSPWGQTTSRNPNFSFLLFFDIFQIFYHINRKHANFQLNWTEDVAYRNSTIFSTKFKAPSQL